MSTVKSNHEHQLRFEDKRMSEKRIRIRIDKRYTAEPIISHLIANFQITINIAGALLSPNSAEDGWFDLELKGTTGQIDSVLSYLNDLDLEIFDQDETDGW